jgi:hypothetical protein
MKSDKLVEAFVIKNSTPMMQMEVFSKNLNDTEQLVIDLSVMVFRLPKRERTLKQLEKELSSLFVKHLGLWGTLSAVASGMYDKSGPLEGVQKSIISKACLKMGYLNPVS